jgi:hypothetical protein
MSDADHSGKSDGFVILSKITFQDAAKYPQNGSSQRQYD